MGRKPKLDKKESHKILTLNFKGNDYESLNKNKDFEKMIYDEVYSSINYAIKNKKQKINLFKLEDQNSIISIKNQNFNSILDKTIEFYAKQDDFEKCSELKKLKEQLE